MVENEEFGEDTPILNTEKISLVFSRYKYPLVFGGFGLLLFLAALLLLLKNQAEKGEVLFSVSHESTTSAEIKIDIQGSVMAPGVYDLKSGSRISDALSLAGGLSADADREHLAKYLNRAAKLTDGQKIYILSVADATSGKSLTDLSNLSDLSQKKLNLNTASSAELEALPGIGVATAAKIISGRPYQKIEDLIERKIVGKAVFEKIKDLLIVF